jgi:hypothetical protein
MRHSNIAPSVISHIVDRWLGYIVVENLFWFEHFGFRIAGMNNTVR